MIFGAGQQKSMRFTVGRKMAAPYHEHALFEEVVYAAFPLHPVPSRDFDANTGRLEKPQQSWHDVGAPILLTQP